MTVQKGSVFRAFLSMKQSPDGNQMARDIGAARKTQPVGVADSLTHLGMDLTGTKTTELA
jgi:hypothetical protein